MLKSEILQLNSLHGLTFQKMKEKEKDYINWQGYEQSSSQQLEPFYSIQCTELKKNKLREVEKSL